MPAYIRTCRLPAIFAGKPLLMNAFVAVSFNIVPDCLFVLNALPLPKLT